MFFRRFYDDQLAQASYLVGCQATGHALVVDPNRHIEPYLRAAEAEGLRITHVTETHIHADFVSGARELARRAGARLLLSDAGGDDWRYRYAAEDGAHAPGRRRPVPGRPRRAEGGAHARAHARAHGVPGDGYRGGERAHGRADRRLRLRGRRGPPGPAGARGARGRHDGSRGATALPLAPAPGVLAGLPAALAGAWGRVGVREGPRRGPADPRSATSAGSIGPSPYGTRTSSCARSSPASRIRRATSRR